jgi:hypothetical protein
VEPGETHEQAARREVFEETGLVIGTLSVLYEDYFELNKTIWRGYLFLANSFVGMPRNMEPDKFSAVRFAKLPIVRGSGKGPFLSDVMDLVMDGEGYECQRRLRLWSSLETLTRA